MKTYRVLLAVMAVALASLKSAWAEGGAVDTLIGTIGTGMGTTAGLAVAAAGALLLIILGFSFAKKLFRMGK